MKYILFFPVIVLSTACRFHSKTGSGNIITEKRTTEAFMAVHADGAVNVEIRKGAESSVTVEADDNIMPYIETKVSGGTLNIRLRELNSLTNVTIHITVVAPALKELNASSAATIVAKDTVSADDHISLKASSGAKLTAPVDAPEIMAESSSGGDITIRGRTKSVTADASSGASLHASALLSENATADASSGATVELSGSLGINATASSGGSVKYSGGAANVVKNESSGGSVRGN